MTDQLRTDRLEAARPALSGGGPVRLLLLALLAGLVIWAGTLTASRYYRLPQSFDLTYLDTGWFAEMGRIQATGGVLYRDIWDTKPPVMFFIIAAFVKTMGNTVAAIEASTLFMDVFFAASITAVAYAVSRSWLAALIGAALALLFSAQLAYPETTIPMAAFGATALAVALLGRGRWPWMLLAGALFTCGVMTKQPLAFELPALLAFAFLRAPGSRRRKLLASSLVLVGGALAAGAFVLWAVDNGIAQKLWFFVFRSASQYVFRADGQWLFSQERLELFQDFFLGSTVPRMAPFFLLAFGSAILLLSRRRRDLLVWVVIGWVVLSFAGASLARGMRPEYYRQMMPSLVALIALAVPTARRVTPVLQVAFSAALLVGAVWFGYRWVGLPAWSAKPPARDAVVATIVDYIKANTQADDCIWPWGGVLYFPYLSERRSCVSAGYEGFMMDSASFPVVINRIEFMQNLFDHPPALEIMESGWGYFKELQKFADRYLGPVVLTRDTFAVFKVDMSKMHRTRANFDDEIGLIAYDLPPKDGYCPGDSLSIALTWQRLATPKGQYQSFVQLVTADETAQIAGHDDVAAVRRPTNTWVDADEIVLGPTFQLQIPPDTASETYRLIAGLYDVETQQRLPTLGADGQPDGSYARLTDVPVGANCPAGT